MGYIYWHGRGGGSHVFYDLGNPPAFFVILTTNGKEGSIRVPEINGGTLSLV
jgi:hypothetical protein